jgi:hypothetical protein
MMRPLQTWRSWQGRQGLSHQLGVHLLMETDGVDGDMATTNICWHYRKSGGNCLQHKITLALVVVCMLQVGQRTGSASLQHGGVYGHVQ